MDQNRFENLNENLFELGLATWRSEIRRYRFGWITNWGRWIKRDLDAPDFAVPLRLVILSDPLDLDLTDVVKREEMLTGVVRFPARYGQGEVDGELLLDGDGEVVTDGMQKRTASSTA